MKTLGKQAILVFFMFISLLSSGHDYPKHHIEKNLGQWPEQVLFRTTLAGGFLFFEKDRLTYNFYDTKQLHQQHGKPHMETENLRFHSYQVIFQGANQNCVLAPNTKTDHYTNYFLGNDPTKWATKVPVFEKLVYEEIFPGIDMEFYTLEGVLKCDFHLSPGADPEDIKMVYRGIENLKLTKGSLKINTSVNQITESAPVAYYTNGTPLACEYKLNNNELSFSFSKGYNAEIGAVIDPELIFSTYSGSGTDNFGYTATFDNEGFLYSGSSAFGAQYPTTIGAYDQDYNNPLSGTDIAITKYDTTGTFLIYSTYLGGSFDELPHSLVVDKDNNLLILGTTSSPDFPMGTTTINDSFGGGSAINLSGIGVNYVNGSDIIVARLNEDGTDLPFSTFIGGSSNDGLNLNSPLKNNYADEVRGEISVDEQGNVYVSSCTFGTIGMEEAFENSFGPSHNGSLDGLVVKIDPDIPEVLWAAYLGGSGLDAIYSVDHKNEKVLLAGGTNSVDLPANSPLQQEHAGGADGFLALVTSNGNVLEHLTYFGSPAYDQFYFAEFDIEGFPHAYGQTKSGNDVFIENVSYSVSNSGMLLTKFNDDLSGVVWSTKFGTPDNTPNISPTAFLVDVCNKIYISGWGGGPNPSGSTTGLPVTNDAIQQTTDGNDFYIMVLEADASSIHYATYFGGNISSEHVDGGTSRFDRSGKIYQSACAGCGSNDDFPIFPDDAWSPTNNSFNCNDGVFKLDLDLPLAIANFTAEDVCLPNPINISNLSSHPGQPTYLWDFGDGNSSNEPNPSHVYNSPGNYTIELILESPLSCNFSDTARMEITVHPGVDMEITEDISSCEESTFTLSANSSGTANSFIWATDPLFQNVINENETDSIITVTPNAPGYYYLLASNSLCDFSDSVFVYPAPQLIFEAQDSLACPGDTLVFSFINSTPGIPIESYSWTPSTYIISGEGSDQVAVLPLENQMLYVSAISENNCTYQDSVFISYFPLELEAFGDTVLCAEAGPVTVSAQSNGLAESYIWSLFPDFSNPLNAPTDSAISVNPPEGETTYYIQVSNGVCTLTDEVEIIRLETEMLIHDILICHGDTGSLSIANIDPSLPLTYHWYPEELILSGQGTSFVSVAPDSSVTISVDANYMDLCSFEASGTVHLSHLGNSIDAYAEPDAISAGGSAMLFAVPDSGLYSYQWSPDEYLSQPLSANTMANPPETTVYTVTISETSPFGTCSRTSSAIISVYDFECGEPYIFVPSAFSPNGDGENDILYVRAGEITDLEFQLFNRWGELVFETSDPFIGWDGLYKGREADPAVFVYHLNAVCADGQKYSKKGNVTLIR